MRAKASHENFGFHLSNEARWSKHQTLLFHTTLPDWGLRPDFNTEIYDYYNQLGRSNEDAPAVDSKSRTLDLRHVLQEDALTRQDDGTGVTRWVKKGEIARGAFGKVYLWERQGLSGEPPSRMVVKDSQTSNFWHDYHAEGELIRQLNERGCKNVVTVLEWLYKPASSSHKAFVRTCYEYAEHGDLGDIGLFYRTRQLLLPEAFLWHIFWSMANALCYCRHGTNQSDKTMPGWDTIVHGDVKPANMLLTPPDDSVDGLYPTIKLCDFGASFATPESIPKVRAWKSTFQYGTSGFWAPEVETAKPRENVPGKFRPVAAYRIHGSHSDVYSLGAVIDQLMDLRFSALQNHPDFDNPHVIDYYSPELRALVKACRKTQVYSRPAIYDVYQQTSEVKWREAALTEANSVRIGRPYQSQVLFSKADRARFDNDPGFRHSYRKTNRAPLLTGKKTIPSHTESVEETAPPRMNQQVLNSRLTEPSSKQSKAASHPGNVTSTSKSKTEKALSTQPSAFVLPGFGAPERRHSPFAASSLRSPPPHPGPIIFGPLDSQVQAAREASNLTPATTPQRPFLAATTETSQTSVFGVPRFGLAHQQSPLTTQSRPSSAFEDNSDIRPSILASPPLFPSHTSGSTSTPPFYFHTNAVSPSPGAPTPSILAPASQPPPIPLATKPGNKRPLEEDDADETPNEEEEEEEQQPKRKISRFIEDLPEAPPRPARRTLRRAGAVRRPERRVRFDVDAEEAEQ
ncbi:MAG: hypothetical protein Q9208_002543 [Pyrenodesmia sp. 3 TL-2023]